MDNILLDKILDGNYQKSLTSNRPTISYGRYISTKNKKMILLMQYCQEGDSDGSVVTLIPVNSITRVNKLSIKSASRK